MVASAFATVTWHFEPEGPVEFSLLDVQPTLVASAAPINAVTTRPIVCVIRLCE
jgi:hypothetical protein